jgi:hypothetical protein
VPWWWSCEEAWEWGVYSCAMVGRSREGNAVPCEPVRRCVGRAEVREARKKNANDADADTEENTHYVHARTNIGH